VLNEPIQVANSHLFKLLTTIGRMPQVPTELVEELFRAHLRLAAHVFDLRHKTAQLDAARADLERI
jgi:hypothetical protein